MLMTFVRSVGDRRQAVRKLGARLSLDRGDEPHHDVVEYADLVVGKARCPADEEIGDAGEYFDPAGVAAGGEGDFELVNERKSTHHNSAPGHAIELSLRMPSER